MKIEVKRGTLEHLDILQVISVETFVDTFGKQNSQEDLVMYLKEAYNIKQLMEHKTSDL